MNDNILNTIELDFHKMLEEVKSFLEKFEDKFIDGDEKEVLTADRMNTNTPFMYYTRFL